MCDTVGEDDTLEDGTRKREWGTRLCEDGPGSIFVKKSCLKKCVKKILLENSVPDVRKRVREFVAAARARAHARGRG